ncbi:uncharacterized protein JDV02_000097 [Neofusicoccum parvum]|uniref:Uncharacterized protein JDV02_000097 n=2 Tax=Neofusicoccum parvum TaxID=310453 RepID=A0ACB5SML6_9PEZI|nr:putative metalloprotease protein [Neofusicoccum parvum UCRNP2]GME48740.1 uncharacterized protein JDV02_000097 [Neofusicoccum parvum]GME49597.1 uncharacterized protein JDV02_000097 [Neofusicoccum parvum]
MVTPVQSRVCFTKVLGVQDNHSIPAKESVSNAVKENPRNGALTLPPAPNAPGGPLGLAMMTRRFWRPGRELRIAFQGGSQWQQDQVKKFAPEWTQYANIKFKFVDSGDKEIWISFDSKGGSYSYLGTDCLSAIARGESSMNLGWIDDNRDDDELRQVILHEFGHALGAVHEHESPMAKIPWNKDAVYKSLGGDPNYWSRETVDNNMFTLYALDETAATEFDGESIMLYYFPPEWTTNGKGTSFNTKLSISDKAYIKFCYPGDDYDAGILNTMEVRPWDKPQADNSKSIYYYKKYNEVPQLPMGLTSLDIDQKANIRIRAFSSDATQEKFKVSLDSWADTVLYSASLTWLERSNSRFDYLQTGTYNTQETRPWNSPQLTPSKRINFAKPFSSPPKVVTFLQSLDMDHSRNWRIRVYATDVDTNGFTVHADSWGDSILYSAGVTWLAYPADQPGVASGKFNTQDVRPANQPRAENSSTVNFDKAFGKPPKVMMALDSLDYDNSKNLRLRLSQSQVTNTGITWHLQSWWDSVMYSSGAQFFAWA